MSFLVDADAHIDIALSDLTPFMEPLWRRQAEQTPSGLFPRDVGDTLVAARIKRPIPRGPAVSPSGGPGATPAPDTTVPSSGSAHADPVGADVRIIFPTQFLAMGRMPITPMGVALVFAFARWATDRFLPENPRSRVMLPLPVADVDACRRLVADFGGHPGVAGFFVSNAGPRDLYADRYFPLYADMEERGLPLAFHPATMWRERPYDLFDQFLGVWALSHPFNHSIDLINWLVHGMPERFPGLRCIFCESGLMWLTFIGHRFDQEYLKRPSEAPLLRERPSHYMRRCWFTTQPLDQVADPSHLQQPVRLVGASQLLYASNYPQWDFDAPVVLDRLSFLSDPERDGIRGGNAARLFQLTEVRA